MELAQQYLFIREGKYRNDYKYVFGHEPIEIEELGECHEVLLNPHAVNRLQVRAREGSIVVCQNGRTLTIGVDYYEIHDQNGSYVGLYDEDNTSLRNGRIEIRYRGYAKKGDHTPWS